MRGKVTAIAEAEATDGITPACAGKRIPEHHCELQHEDHPRLCGEKTFSSTLVFNLPGSPPPVRGKDAKQDILYGVLRITPACAGKS